MKYKIFKIIGIMSGTSIDGIDFSYMKTNGKNYAKIIFGKSYKYPNDYIRILKNFIKNKKIKNSKNYKKIDQIITSKFIFMSKKFIKDFKINKSEIDYISLSGQTIIHKPEKKISIQLGSGKNISNKLGINIVYDFRKNDIKNGGQGAPIGAFYNKFISEKLKKNFLFINIGGISNICFANKKKLIAFDVGPGNCLIDDYIWIKKRKKFDNNGAISLRGKINKKIINEFLKDKYFKKKYPKSLDRQYFNNYIKKCKKLSLKDGLSTLSMMTVYSIKMGIEEINEKIDKIILSGGGRKNKFFVDNLKKILKINIIKIDNIGKNGDLFEAEAFAYIAARSINNLPISLKSTTGVKRPTTGGNIYKIK